MARNPANDPWLGEVAKNQPHILQQMVVSQAVAAAGLGSVSTATDAEYEARNQAAKNEETSLARLDQYRQREFVQNPQTATKTWTTLLPVKELRDLVYKYTQPQDRVVEMRFSRRPGDLTYDFVDPEFPVLLHVCFESRMEMMQLGYELLFRDTRAGGVGSSGVWFNPYIDTLFIRVGDLSTRSGMSQYNINFRRRIRQNAITNMADKHLVKKLAVEYNEVEMRQHAEFTPIPLHFVGLKELVFLVPQPLRVDHVGTCQLHRSCITHLRDLRQLTYPRLQEAVHIGEFYKDEMRCAARFLQWIRTNHAQQWREPKFMWRSLCINGIGNDRISSGTSFYHDNSRKPKRKSKPKPKPQPEPEPTRIKSQLELDLIARYKARTDLSPAQIQRRLDKIDEYFKNKAAHRERDRMKRLHAAAAATANQNNGATENDANVNKIMIHGGSQVAMTASQNGIHANHTNTMQSHPFRPQGHRHTNMNIPSYSSAFNPQHNHNGLADMTTGRPYSHPQQSAWSLKNMNYRAMNDRAIASGFGNPYAMQMAADNGNSSAYATAYAPAYASAPDSASDTVYGSDGPSIPSPSSFPSDYFQWSPAQGGSGPAYHGSFPSYGNPFGGMGGI